MTMTFTATADALRQLTKLILYARSNIATLFRDMSEDGRSYLLSTQDPQPRVLKVIKSKDMCIYIYIHIGIYKLEDRG